MIWCSGCSTSTIHVYARHLNTQEIDQVSKIFERVGYQVITNDLHFPENINSSAIIYSPFFEDPEAIDKILVLLEDNGWKITSASSLFAGNHWYRKNDVAILLIPDRLLSDGLFDLKNIAGAYDSNHCSTGAKLILDTDNTYEFTVEDDSGDEGYAKGSWKFTQYPYVELRSTNRSYYFYFSVEHDIISDNIGKVEITELLPENEYYFLPGCSFIRGIRT